VSPPLAARPVRDSGAVPPGARRLPVSDPCRPRRAGPTGCVKLPSAGGPWSWVAAGRLLRRLVRPSFARLSPAGPTATCSPAAPPGGRPVPVRLEHDRLGEGPVGDRAGPA